MIGTRAKKIPRVMLILVGLFAAMCLTFGVYLSSPHDMKPLKASTTGGTITVNFYSPDNVYAVGDEGWVVWAWIPGGMDGKLALPTGVSNDFFQESTPENKAQTFEVPITAKGAAALANGADFGFVVTRMKTGGDAPIWSKKDISKDRLTKVALDGNGVASVYTIKGDGDCYTDITSAKQAFEQVLSAMFSTKTAITFETTSPIAVGAKLSVLDGEKKIVEDAEIVLEGDTGRKGSAIVNIPNFDYAVNYKVLVSGFFKPKSISKTKVMKSAEFLSQFKANKEMGAIYTKASTTFRAFAPIATSMSISFFATSRPEDKAQIMPTVYMSKGSGTDWDGVWEAVVEGDLDGVYYVYNVTNYDVVTESIDPYAKAGGVNGDRGMVIDFDRTDPTGWDTDKHVYQTTDNETEPIIYELHVRDFSIKANSGIKNKGKFLAFTEDNTTVVGDDTIKTGLSHIKDLGVNYVHLLPVFDFATVDESRMNDINYDVKFNWGYDPKNYNMLEGSYSTDPYDGAVRISEFKQLVKSLHDNGIGVVMDVVYNHTYSIGGSSFDKLAPSYYHRTNDDGVYTDGSGCNNETACEKYMVDKYMRDSIKFWADEYHIDGFRFDLMALHTIGTMNSIRNDMDAKYGANNILLYGEPWAAQQNTVPSIDGNTDTYPADLNNWRAREDGIAMFSNTIRDGIRGEHGDMGSNKGPFGGYVNGKLDNLNMVKSGVQGGIHDGLYQMSVKTRSPRQQIVYSSAHDNYTLWDQIVMSQSDRGTNNINTPSDTTFRLPNDYYIKSNKMAATIMLMSKGQVFIHAGEEMARTKYGNHNSFNSPDAVNAIDYSRKKEFNSLYEHYKGMIALRKNYDFLTDMSYESAKNDIYFLNNYTGGEKHYWVDGNDGYDTTAMLGFVVRSGDPASRKYLAVVVNPYSDKAVNAFIGNTGTWADNKPLPLAWHYVADGNAVGFNLNKKTTTGIVSIPVKSGVVISTVDPAV